MWQRIMGLLRGPEPKSHRFVPSSPDLPELWPQGANEPQLDVLDEAPSPVLMALCDNYWNSFLGEAAEDSFVRDSSVHRRALEILATRAGDALPWARQRLSHPGYDAREDAASLIVQWAENDSLGHEKEATARELVTLANIPPRDDTKEAQAASMALRALAVIGGPHCLAAARHVLTSPDWEGDDNQWDCAEILAELTGEPFMQSDDPVRAAKEWIENIRRMEQVRDK
jgi:hypothetical protein